jgi:hypothetical protein
VFLLYRLEHSAISRTQIDYRFISLPWNHPDHGIGNMPRRWDERHAHKYLGYRRDEQKKSDNDQRAYDDINPHANEDTR